MPLPGTPMQPREIAALIFKTGWRDKEMITALAVCLSESNGYPLAYNDNMAEDGVTIKTRDVGLFQINIGGEYVGTEVEERLYEVTNNVKRAYRMYAERQWRPWYGWLNGYATSPDWWFLSKKGYGYLPTGRFLHRANRGVANYWAEKYEGLEPPLLDYFLVPEKPIEPADYVWATDGLRGRGFEDVELHRTWRDYVEL